MSAPVDYLIVSYSQRHDYWYVERVFLNDNQTVDHTVTLFIGFKTEEYAHDALLLLNEIIYKEAANV